MFSRFLKKNNTTVSNFEEKRLFLNEEEVFFGRLRRALPNCYIFPKVDLSSLMEPASMDAKQHREALEQLKDRKVDYAICDASLNLLCVIELTSPNSENEHEVPNSDYLKNAAIKSIRWNKQPLPSAEQILRTLAPFSSLESPKPDIASHTVIRNSYVESSRSLDTAQAMFKADPEPSNILGLSIATLEKLAPHGYIKASYPHVWQRICLFCNEPKHLKKYLETLFLQDRGVERAGFPQEVIKEITDIQSENERFLQLSAPRTTWEQGFHNR
ncbi:MAG: DUF2726 domain-containing protein [Undibacterium sp.]|jgi:hypothetical protein|nr:DUF2726 domain-containing protein [Undibacterium sp.]MDO8701013.1 DUF2726 domain-containing protein [Undibacterium sp.]